MRRSTRQLTAGILLAGALAASADAALIAHYPLKDGGAGTPVTGAAEVIDGDAGVHKNAVVTSPGAPGGTWFNDPSRGIVFSTGEDDRLFAGTQGIDRAVGFTWSLWANVASSNLTDSGADVLIGTRAASGGVWNKIEVGLATTGAMAQNWASINQTSTIADNTWHHVTYLGDSTSVRLYIDGVLIGSDATTPTPVGNVFDGRMEFGGSSQFSEDVTGLMSDIAIWNEALTANEVAAIFQITSHNGLLYNAGQFDLLKQIHDAGTGTVDIGDLRWTYATGLSGAAGLSGSNPAYTLILNSQAGTGLTARLAAAPIPEPASAALGLMAVISLGAMRRRRQA